VTTIPPQVSTSRPRGTQNIRGPRLRAPLLALEASLLENRSAARSAMEARLTRRGERRLARAPVPVPTQATSVAITGWRRHHFPPLVHEDLWKDGQGPLEQTPAKEHHKCGICHLVKSHPVS
jgi:hypothetical protein